MKGVKIGKILFFIIHFNKIIRSFEQWITNEESSMLENLARKDYDKLTYIRKNKNKYLWIISKG